MSTYYTKAEKLLVKRCLNLDPKAQRQLYDQYVKAVYHTCLRICAHESDAEDVTQEVFIRVFRCIGSFKGESTLGAWIKKIAVNTSLNHLRSKQNLHPLNEIHNQDTAQLEDIESQSDWSVEAIHQAIQGLPAGSRSVLTLHLLEGYQHKEIAKILGITESTSKSQYHRAKKLLQNNLKNRKPFRLGLL